MGWCQTIERQHVFKFGMEYMPGNLANFYTKPGNPGGFDPTNIVGKKIGNYYLFI